MGNVEKLKELIEKSKSIVFFGGAGVSTQSGIPDFRSADGLYSESYGAVSPETVLSHDFFVHHTAEFYEFYKSKMLYPDAQPNAAHFALAELEKRGKLKAVITQNIDGLHQKAGSETVHELHGSAMRNKCMKCKKVFSLDYVIESNGVPVCNVCGSTIKPDVVLYGEMLDDDVWEKAAKATAESDLLIVGGTSLAVYPAANIVRYFDGDNIVLINMSETQFDKKASLVIREPIGDVFEQAMKLL